MGNCSLCAVPLTREAGDAVGLEHQPNANPGSALDRNLGNRGVQRVASVCSRGKWEYKDILQLGFGEWGGIWMRFPQLAALWILAESFLVWLEWGGQI